MNVVDSFINMYSPVGDVIVQIVDFTKIEECGDCFRDTDIVFSLMSPNKALVKNAKTYEDLVITLWCIKCRDRSSMKFDKSQKKYSKLLILLGFHSYRCFHVREQIHIVSTCVHTHFLSSRWLQNKGDIEEIVKKTGFEHVSVFRPGFTLNVDGMSMHLLDSLSSSLSVGTLVHIMRLEAGTDLDGD